MSGGQIHQFGFSAILCADIDTQPDMLIAVRLYGISGYYRLFFRERTSRTIKITNETAAIIAATIPTVQPS